MYRERFYHINQNKEARLCAFEHDVPVRLNHAFDLIVNQMRRRYKTGISTSSKKSPQPTTIQMTQQLIRGSMISAVRQKEP